MLDDMSAATPSPVALLDRECRSLVQRLRLWTPARYAAAAGLWGTRADLIRHLAQCLADLAADAEGEPRRSLPVLDSDLGLADQLMVTAHDLVRRQLLDETAERATAHVLMHRQDLLAEAIPVTLEHRLGAPLLTSVRQQCGT